MGQMPGGMWWRTAYLNRGRDSPKQLFCFLFPVRRLLHSFRALAGAVRGSDVIRVVLLFLHFDLKNKATSF